MGQWAIPLTHDPCDPSSFGDHLTLDPLSAVHPLRMLLLLTDVGRKNCKITKFCHAFERHGDARRSNMYSCYSPCFDFRNEEIKDS
jgi:hypothetical protein